MFVGIRAARGQPDLAPWVAGDITATHKVHERPKWKIDFGQRLKCSVTTGSNALMHYDPFQIPKQALRSDYHRTSTPSPAVPNQDAHVSPNTFKRLISDILPFPRTTKLTQTNAK